jgi:phosphopantothenoylcysteine decarboxylase / phosphopantothenate---cysteine ligase
MTDGSLPPPPESLNMAQPPPMPAYQPLMGKEVVVAVTGSVAAYKAALLVRLLIKAGAEVQVIMTRSAKAFVGPATFSGLTGNPVIGDMFDPGIGGELHVDIAHESDAIVVMPATADSLARFAQGRTDDTLTATVLCATCPVLAVPAMHPSMWAHPATQRNVAALEDDGRIGLVGPVQGEVASGDKGVGRMAEPEAVLAAVVACLSPQDLIGSRIVVTAGPTAEDLDPVRFITNRSSGRMGYAVAERAAARGATVELIAGPTSLNTPPGVLRIEVRSALEMQAALEKHLTIDGETADALVMAAAVGDYRPASAHEQKQKRQDGPASLALEPNPDLISEIGKSRDGGRPVLVGFAVETLTGDELVEEARRKLRKKSVDMVVANHARDSFGRETNIACIVEESRVDFMPELPKPEVADRILNWVSNKLASDR